MSLAAPCLRSDLVIVPRLFRGTASYVVKDLPAQKYYRFGATEVRVMRCFDGHRTGPEIVAALANEGVRLSAPAVEGFARTLAARGFFERTLDEKTTLEMERLRAERHQRRRSRLFRGEILRMRWSFGDHDELLSRVLPHIRWIFTPGFVAVSIALFIVYATVLGQHWTEFTSAVAATYSVGRITLVNGAILWAIAALVIAAHELGHAFTCKYYGGEVREMGFMLLYFQPAFYCNVSDAWSFPERRARLWVTAAGAWIQLVCASLASLSWLAAAPGSLPARAGIAAMLIGGGTVLITNANPLLPLDGYFALTDWLEIPNLRRRAFDYVQWWIKARALGVAAPAPAATTRERRVFAIYGALSVVYAFTIFAVFASLVLGWAGKAFGIAGAAITGAAIVFSMRARIIASARTARLAVRAHRARLGSTRLRRIVAVGSILAFVVLVLPWTLTSPGTFVIRPAVTLVATAPVSGVVDEVLVAEGDHVSAGTPLLRLVDHALDRDFLEALRLADSLSLAETAARASGGYGGAARASRLAAERATQLGVIAALEARAHLLMVRAVGDGVVITQRPEALVGHRVAAGDALVTLASLDSVELRIALAAGATRVRAGQLVHAVSYADIGAPWTGVVGSVSAADVPADSVGQPAVIEARVRRSADAAWRVGVHGEARIDLARSTILGALWWNARQAIRADLWL
jgi:putative peptide zinc metalloprotease protein